MQSRSSEVTPRFALSWLNEAGQETDPFIFACRKRRPSDALVRDTFVRELRNHDEKAMKMLLIGMLVTSGLFYVLSEKVFAQGFNDLFITRVPAVYRAKYAWMFELKYVVTDADEKTKEAAFEQAEAQLRMYASDPHLVPMLTRGLGLKAGTLLFVGGKELLFREYVPTQDSSTMVSGSLVPGHLPVPER